MDIISRINIQLPHLRLSEQKVAKLILEDIQYASQASINDLASKAKVSHACITRLSKALDCENVRDFKLQLAQAHALQERFTSNKMLARKDIPEIYHAIIRSLEHNATLISDQTVSAAVELIAKANHVLIFGVGGGSTVLAQECHNRLFRLSVHSNPYSDPMLMRMTASNIDKNDVVICLSLGGYSPDVEAAAKIAQGYGGHVVAICPEGDLAEVADIHMPIEIKETEYIFKPSTSRYVMMAAIDILATELAVKNQRKSREKLRRLKAHLDEHRAGPDRLPLGD